MIESRPAWRALREWDKHYKRRVRAEKALQKEHGESEGEEGGGGL